MEGKGPHTDEIPTRPENGAFQVWFAYWSSAAVAFPLLVTSVMPGMLPLSHATWLSLHLSLGWTLLTITIYRCIAALKWMGQRQRLGAPRGIVAWASFAVLSVTIATGLPLFRPSPLGGKVYLFGFFRPPSFHFPAHNAIMVLLQTHHYLAYGLSLLFAAHVFLAFVPYRKAGPLPARWLWTGFRVY